MLDCMNPFRLLHKIDSVLLSKCKINSILLDVVSVYFANTYNKNIL